MPRNNSRTDKESYTPLLVIQTGQDSSPEPARRRSSDLTPTSSATYRRRYTTPLCYNMAHARTKTLHFSTEDDHVEGRLCGCCFRSCWNRIVIVPRDSKGRSTHWIEYWDLVVIFLMILTAIIIPMEAALKSADNMDPMFQATFFDALFTFDTILQFFIAYPVISERSAMVGYDIQSDRCVATFEWETDPWMIATRYCGIPFSHGGKAGWFWIDMISLLPAILGAISGSNEAPFRNLSLSNLRLLRTLKLLRLLRILRLQSLVYRFQSVMGFSFHALDILRFSFMTMIACHWFACIWIMAEGTIVMGLISYHAEEGKSWLSQWIDHHGDPCSPNAGEDPLCVYILSIYWATMTLTTVGYGDIVPANMFEFKICTVLIVVSGAFWAYVTGIVVSTLQNIDPHTKQFKQTMDDLNSLMVNRNLPHDLRVKLRRYMYESESTLRWKRQWDCVSNNLSDKLQHEVIECTDHSFLLKGVYWAVGLEDEAQLALVKSMKHVFFGYNEYIRSVNEMFIVVYGRVAAKGRILKRGDVWGHENILLVTEALIDTASPRTLTYVELLTLTKAALSEVCRTFPKCETRIRRAQIRVATYRAFCIAAFTKKMRMKQDQGVDDSSQASPGVEIDNNRMPRRMSLSSTEVLSAEPPRTTSILRKSRRKPSSPLSRSFGYNIAGEIREDMDNTMKKQEDIQEQLERLEDNMMRKHEDIQDKLGMLSEQIALLTAAVKGRSTS